MSDEFEAKVKANAWDTNLNEVIDFIVTASADPVYTPDGKCIDGRLYWSWVKNMRCKYVSIRFDMRDGAFVLLDKDGERISLEQLKRQHGEETR